MAKIQLNGKKISIKTNSSILDLLKKYKLNNKKIAIEHNGTIIQKFQMTPLWFGQKFLKKLKTVNLY